MDNMHEIVNLAQFARGVIYFAIALPLLGLVVGLVARAVLKGLAVGLLGPLVYGLWLVYSWLIRYDPVTGYCGLHKTAVLWLNVCLFALVGVALGAFYGWLFRGRRASEQAAAGAIERQDEGAAERQSNGAVAP
jgi:hypothetical protein